MVEEEIIFCLFKHNPDLEGHVTIIKPREFLSGSQVDMLLSIAKEKNDKYFTVIKTLLGTGMKPSEIANVLVSDVNFKERMIAISGHGESKDVNEWTPRRARQYRKISIDENLALILELFCTRNDGKSKYLFPSSRGKRYDFKSILTIINTMAFSCDVIGKNIGAHVLRRTFAMNRIRSGMKVDDLARHLGLKSVAIMLKYVFDCKIEGKSGFIHKET